MKCKEGLNKATRCGDGDEWTRDNGCGVQLPLQSTASTYRTIEFARTICCFYIMYLFLAT